MKNTIFEPKISPNSGTSPEEQLGLLVPQDAEFQGIKERGYDVQETVIDFGEMSKRAVVFNGSFFPLSNKICQKQKSLTPKGAISFLFSDSDNPLKQYPWLISELF